MQDLRELAMFMTGKGFWYVDPIKEIKGMKDEDLFFIPSPKAFPIIWHLGHIAHRERVHIGVFLQGLKDVIPQGYDVFGTDWHSLEEIKRAFSSVQEVIDWAIDVREKSYEYIMSLSEEDFFKPLDIPTEDVKTPAQWIFITAAHTSVHVGKIQLLRTLVEKSYEDPC